MSKFYIHTLGCPKNQVDSENLARHLCSKGLVSVKNPEAADVILVNTCGFIREAKEESIEEILTLLQQKRSEQRLVVFGCLAQRYRKELEKELPEVDAIFGVESTEDILRLIENGQGVETDNEIDLLTEPETSHAYIKIAEGCDRECSFCVIPSIRGGFRSVPPDEIIKRAETLISLGVKELILVAQDITSYGKDLEGYDIKKLIRDLASLEGDFWLRLLYLYPTRVDKEILETIAENEKICNYLDIPLQHSEERILRLMGRGGSQSFYKGLIEMAREIIPDIVLRTTFIVGFPSESEQEFEALLDFISSVEFDRLGAFVYSREEDTEAYSLNGQLPERTKEERYHRLMTLQADISLRKNKAMIGKELKVLVDEVSEDVAVGRYYGQTPEIDGVVIIEKAGKELTKGEFIKVRIVEAYDYDLKGKVI